MNYDLQAYLQKDDGTSAAVNTRSLFPGMYVLEAKGLADYGKAKNIVTESYADGDGLKHYEPSDGVIHREATDVTLKLFFCDDGGTNRYAQYDNFISYVESCAVWYWDSVRKRKVRLLFTDKSSPSENFHGNIEYIEAEVKFKNVDGYSIQLAKWGYSWAEYKCAKSNGSNTGVARYKKLTITNGQDTPDPFYITTAFTQNGHSYGNLNDSNFQNLTDENYATRLNDFNDYVFAQMAAFGYIDFVDDVASIVDGASVYNTDNCPTS